MGAKLRTGEVAARAGVNVQTLRYYERRGLLPDPRRLASGYRAYPPDAVRTVRFIKRAQSFGFSLAEVEALLGLARDGQDGCPQARELADARIADMDRRIAEMQAMRDSLRQIAASCGQPHADPGCPLTHAIEVGAE